MQISTKNNAEKGAKRNNMQVAAGGVDENFKEMLAAR